MNTNLLPFCLAVKLLTEESKNADSSLRNIPIAFNPENVQLTEADLALRPAEIKDEPTIDDWNDDTKEVAAEFEAYYGTSIRSVIPNDNEAYLDFSRSSTETQEKLNQLLATSTAKSLASKCTLTADIEQQFAIAPLRVSSRQKKKTLAETRKGTLPNWFDMPRVTEITKEQEKDLAALKMRHVWNSKSFYKKSCLNDVGQSGPDTSKFFQLGTVIEDKTDFYADRVPKKQRKQTIVDELMADQEAKANQKRKIAAMMSNGRQRLMMLKAKQRRQKKRIKERKDDKYEKAIGDAGMKKQVNAFRTYEL